MTHVSYRAKGEPPYEADVDYVVESLASALERDDLHEVAGGRIAAN